MPKYDYVCAAGHLTERVTTIAAYQKQITCDCGREALRCITEAPVGFVKGNLPAYACPITGNIIDGRKAHEENLARHGCRILETGERENVIKQKAREEAAFDAAVEATAEEFVAKLPTAKLEQLGRELESGADVVVERT